MDEMGATSVQVTPPLPDTSYSPVCNSWTHKQTPPLTTLSLPLSLSHSNTVSCAKFNSRTTGLVLLNKINYNKGTSISIFVWLVFN